MTLKSLIAVIILMVTFCKFSIEVTPAINITELFDHHYQHNFLFVIACFSILFGLNNFEMKLKWLLGRVRSDL